MNAYLLYSQREWVNAGRYSDDRTIIQDLGLKTLFSASAKEIETEDGKIKLVREADPFLEDTMKKVMMIPLKTEEEILYRQEVLKDCYRDEGFIYELYELSAQILRDWDKLGRKVSGKAGMPSSRNLVTKIHVLQLFVDSLKSIKGLLAKHQEKLRSGGFTALRERLQTEFSDQLQKNLERILRDVAFYANENEHEETVSTYVRMVNKPKMVLGCRIGDGLKPDDFRLDSLATEMRKFRSPNSALGRAQDYFSSLSTASFSVRKGSVLREQADSLEYELVCYIISCCEPFFDSLSTFFDQLHFQAAFYRGAVNLRHYMERFDVHRCFPGVCEQENLRFADLKELVMAIEQRTKPIGNTCLIDDKLLLIVTGANQGGKSTFLRSVGIAQIMMQCGLPVAAESFESGIFPSFFTHFTRREDSEMNSGRLNEELKRMSQIVDRLEGDSMVLLNESFASTTEKEGSVIAYDITRALIEAGVKVLTVTHLLSFAQRVYGECRKAEAIKAAGSGELGGAAAKADGSREPEGASVKTGGGKEPEGMAAKADGSGASIITSGSSEPEGTIGRSGNDASGSSAVSGRSIGSHVEFLSAQRMEDGRRTFKMIQHAPELTSFGLDLYDKIVPVKNHGPEKLP